MSVAFTYEIGGRIFDAGWEMNHGMIWLSFRDEVAFAKCGETLEENIRIRDNALHQLLVRAGLAEPIPGQIDVLIKIGW